MRLPVLVGIVALTAATQAGATGSGRVEAATGQWDLALEGSYRKCRITLSGDGTGTGRILRFPATCRRALPVLNGLGGWSSTDRGTIRLLDAMGQPVLTFEGRKTEDAGLTATASTGEVYRLEPAERSRQDAPTPVAFPSPALGVPQRTAVDPATAPRPDMLPGAYAVDRYQERDLCRIGLLTTGADPSGRFPARLLEGCRDPGMAIFDPVAWRYEAGRLTVYARRGHAVTLVSERKDQWRRDPEVGATLILRKIESP